jgi:ATP-dependent DNA helicase RecG
VLELEEVLRAHIDTRVVIAGEPVERRQTNVPFEALQQIVRNAVIHRQYEATNAPVRVTWFDDRIEVQSPGGPFGAVDAANFGRPGVTDYRNPTLATTLAQMGIVQRFGVGIQVARSSMERNGNPPLRFQVEPTYVNAVLPVVQR